MHYIKSPYPMNHVWLPLHEHQKLQYDFCDWHIAIVVLFHSLGCVLLHVHSLLIHYYFISHLLLLPSPCYILLHAIITSFPMLYITSCSYHVWRENSN